MERERVTISIKKSVLDKVDRAIDGTSIRNRSHAFESLLLKGLGNSDTKSAIILMGGDDAIKSIPNVELALAGLKEMGFEKINIATGFLGDKVKEKLGDGSKYGLNFTYNDKGEGSGGAVLTLKKELKNTFIVINHHTFTDFKISHLLDFHKKHKFLATIATDDLNTLQGIYILEPEIVAAIPKGFSMLEDDVLPKLIREGKVAVCSMK
jgi:NDP-sugar pyrophosphorylase family protein